MANPSKDLFNARAPFMVPYAGGVEWVDFYVHLAEGWLDWQRAMWQPLVDAQAEYMRQWSEQSGWPIPQAVPTRGGEQLA